MRQNMNVAAAESEWSTSKDTLASDIANDYADRFVQDGKGPGPYSRLRLSRSETSAEKRDRRTVLSALALPFELPVEENAADGSLGWLA
jgi:hypothetical protein